ncbi:MAG TPA: hypothetical protein VGX25_02810 [Actinophytocola sp.]|uniref:hypothetical protein n=1 Tax=Actinophytocola sp. TaxID=1872138 RepID=UPI002DDC9AA8|nr:hypothetical protein [Actinophytocola sp.]HEV2778308.1 hypothetical protein [Actinophytocola sp.]
MTTFSTDPDPGIESELIDLSTVPFALLRDLDGATLHGALRHVVERTGQVRITSRSSGSSGGERID